MYTGLPSCLFVWYTFNDLLLFYTKQRNARWRKDTLNVPFAATEELFVVFEVVWGTPRHVWGGLRNSSSCLRWFEELLVVFVVVLGTLRRVWSGLRNSSSYLRWFEELVVVFEVVWGTLRRVWGGFRNSSSCLRWFEELFVVFEVVSGTLRRVWGGLRNSSSCLRWLSSSLRSSSSLSGFLSMHDRNMASSSTYSQRIILIITLCVCVFQSTKRQSDR